MKQQMACPVLIDVRNIYSGEDMASQGFLYAGVGRPDRGEPKGL